MIYEVMEAIVLNNQTINDNFVNEALEKVSLCQNTHGALKLR